MTEEREDTLDLVTVRGDEVREYLTDDFPELTEWKKIDESMYESMYELRRSNNQGCYFSVKVPNNVNKAGKALHIVTLYQKGDKSYTVYPSKKMGQKLGEGTFASRSVHRDKKWRQNLSLEAKTGKELCTVLYEKKHFYNDSDKKKIYDTFDQRIETRKALSKKHAHCNALERDSSKAKCRKEEKDLESELDRINDRINSLLK